MTPWTLPFILCIVIKEVVCFRVGENEKRIRNCIRSSSTSCDVTHFLTDLTSCYSADVLSEPLPGVTSDLIEFPYTSSSRFCPFEHSRFSLFYNPLTGTCGTVKETVPMHVEAGQR